MPKTCKSENCPIGVFSGGYCRKHQYLRIDIKVNRPLRFAGNKRNAYDKIYSFKRRMFLAANPLCQAKLSNCTKIASEIHHKKGRGIYFLDDTTYLGVCRSCHNWIEMHPREAKELNLSQSRL